jgi:uncharacterized protein YdeI (YjbR/CyaY-like superfamily)
MGKRDARVDAYIEKAEDFARPILVHLRKLVHAACPDVEETIKWTFPNFLFKGILCSMAGFKRHCTFGFWHPVMRRELIKGGPTRGMGQFGRITSMEDLPPDGVTTKYIREAMKLADVGVKVSRKRPMKREPLKIPAILTRALKANPKSLANFKAMSFSHQKEYVQWISEAKQEETRERRVRKAVAMISQGKSQNWKYETKR